MNVNVGTPGVAHEPGRAVPSSSCRWCSVSRRSGRARGPGPRSVEALEWLARLDVAGLEPLGLALGTRRATTYSHVARLASVGWVTRLYDRDGSVVAITREGRQAVGLAGGGARPGQLSGVGRAHARAVSWMAALMTIRDREWVSDREARERADWLVPVMWAGSQGTHRPDLGVTLSGQRVAVEVELSHKAPRRLRAILAGYEAAIESGALSGGVLYVSDRPAVLDTVRRAAEQAGIPGDRFRTRELAEIQASARKEAAARIDATPTPAAA